MKLPATNVAVQKKYFDNADVPPHSEAPQKKNKNDKKNTHNKHFQLKGAAGGVKEGRSWSLAQFVAAELQPASRKSDESAHAHREGEREGERKRGIESEREVRRAAGFSRLLLALRSLM